MMTPGTIEYDLVPHLEDLQSTLRADLPELSVNAVPVTPQTMEDAKGLIEVLAEACCVDVHVQGGKLCFVPAGFVTEKNLTLLILWRLPMLAAYRWGFVRKALPDLDMLGKDLESELFLKYLKRSAEISLGQEGGAGE